MINSVTNARTVKRWWYLAAVFLTALFVVYTWVVCWVDVQALDTQSIGCATINLWWRDLVGVNAAWHVVSNVVAVVAFLTVGALLVWQVVVACRTKPLRQLPRHWWMLDVVLVGLVGCYLLFQIVVINYRPLLLHGVAEVSYPSSHVLLFATVFPLAILTVWRAVQSRPWRVVLTVLGIAVMVVGMVARVMSGYHWLTDLVGGAWLGAVLVTWNLALTA